MASERQDIVYFESAMGICMPEIGENSRVTRSISAQAIAAFESKLKLNKIDPEAAYIDLEQVENACDMGLAGC